MKKSGSVAMKEKSKIPMPKKSWPAKNQSGAAMIEYALLVALILTVCITSVMTIGGVAQERLTEVGAAFGDQIQPN